MASTLPYVVLLLLALLCVERVAECQLVQNEDTLRGNDTDDRDHVKNIYRLGVWYFISSGDLRALQITTNSVSLLNLTLINRDGDRDAISTAPSPFLASDNNIGSGSTPTQPPEELEAPYVYTIYHHHAYIAVGQDVIVLLLNTETPNYHRVSLGHIPLQINVREFGGITYLHSLYETDDGSGYVTTYRKYGPGNWVKQGQHDLLVYSPRWFRHSDMSNVIFFSADNLYYSYKATYVAVASGYTVYFKDIFDGSHFSIALPEPCNKITSIDFNEFKQSMFVVCSNVTFYFDYVEYQLLSSGIWNRTGLTSFSQDGQIAAIQTNHSGGMTTVTIHGLNFKPSTEDEMLYEFHHFHHVASRSLIIKGVFVTVSNNNHFFCYIEMMEYGIVCIDVEGALRDVRRDGIISDATFLLPKSGSVLCSSIQDCPVMYSHKEVLVLQVRHCESRDTCTTVAMVYNMSSLENIANITGITLEMLVYKADPIPILLSTPMSQTNTSNDSNTSGIPRPSSTATTPGTTSLSIFTERTKHNIVIASPLPTTTIVPGSDGEDNAAHLLEVCQNDLTVTNTAYSRLLTVTIVLCISFCIAMLVTILLLVGLVLFSRREKHNKT